MYARMDTPRHFLHIVFSYDAIWHLQRLIELEYLRCCCISMYGVLECSLHRTAHYTGHYGLRNWRLPQLSLYYVDRSISALSVRDNTHYATR